MRQKQIIPTFLLVALIIFFISNAITTANSSDQNLSGSVKDGYRILDIKPDRSVQYFTVYRGDYIKFIIPPNTIDPTFILAGVKENQALTHDLKTTPYFKMKQAGVYLFQIGSIQGKLRVIEYDQPNYQLMTAEQANEYINTKKPFILDVRTPKEYAAGHLENSTLIPVQELTSRIEELESNKTNAILVYCASGNRSTVASKILIDNGFSTIINLKYGIKDWFKRKYKVIR
ncbi:MAG: rhodanese-like domain-containing protein [Pseudomonadota bacterium]